MQVSATEPDREDAAAIVNAVVDAYMNEVVNYDRQQRRDRLSELQQISAEKENEVRTKREQLKRELENIGAGDDETMKARGQLAVNMYAQFHAEFQRMRAEHRVLLGKLQEAKTDLAELPAAEIPETEVVMLLNNNPMYRDLQSRLTILEQMQRHPRPAPPCPEQGAPGFARTKADYDATKAQLDRLGTSSPATWSAAPSASPWSRRSAAWKARWRSPPSRWRPSKRKSSKKATRPTTVGRSSVAAQMARAEVDNVERILHGVAEERERLRVELRCPARVRSGRPERACRRSGKRDARMLPLRVHCLRSVAGPVRAGRWASSCGTSARSGSIPPATCRSG